MESLISTKNALKKETVRGFSRAVVVWEYVSSVIVGIASLISGLFSLVLYPGSP